jgi:hypothetical protein
MSNLTVLGYAAAESANNDSLRYTRTRSPRVSAITPWLGLPTPT